MDDLDFRLLATLHQDGLQSHAALARALKLSPAGVGSRLARLESAGVLRGFWMLFEPAVLQRYNRILIFEGQRWGEREAEQAMGAPEVAFVALKHDGNLTVQTFPAAPDGPDPAPLREVLGAEPTRVVAGKDASPFPVLSPLDWRVLGAMLDEPRMQIAHLAERTGLSPKTIRAHRKALVDQGWVRVLPLLGPLQGGQAALFHTAVYWAGPPDGAALRKAWPDAVVVNKLSSPPSWYLFCKAEDLAGSLAAQRALKAVPGVAEARLDLNRGFFLNRERLRGWVAEQRAQWEQARRAAPA